MIMSVKSKFMVLQAIAPVQKARAHGADGKENTGKRNGGERDATRARTDELQQAVRGSECAGPRQARAIRSSRKENSRSNAKIVERGEEQRQPEKEPRIRVNINPDCQVGFHFRNTPTPYQAYLAKGGKTRMR
jgi:hypothetical protein